MTDQNIAREFQEFAYIVSHDLQAPLRHIREFTRLLLGSLQDDLSDEQKTHAAFIATALRRLDGMHAALLSYSRIATRSNPPTQTDTGPLVERILADLAPLQQKSGAKIKLGALPSLHADADQLRMVFSCLIENALIFQDSGAPVAIEIAAEEKDSAIVFSVRDNGIGIAPEFHNDIFKMFRRLHPAGQYSDGPGAGLTLAKKVVERHGGRIWVDSAPGQGSTFFFSLPKAESDHQHKKVASL